MSEISVTILVCTRNRPEQLRRCLESLCELDYCEYDLIVVDNASDVLYIPELAYPRRTRFYHYPVPGLSSARNAVLPFVTGELLALIDDDATADRQWLKNGTAPFEDSDIGCVTGRILPLEITSESQQRLLANPFLPNWDEPREFDQISFNPFTTAVGTGSNWLARMKCFEKNSFPKVFGPGTPTFAGDEHYVFHLIVQSGWRIRYEPSAIVYHEYPATEEANRMKHLRDGVSRGAYLTKFLIAENGYRLSAMKYLMSRSIARDTDVPREFTTSKRGLFRGPLALLRSYLQQKQSTEARLISEFAPKNS